MKFNITPNPGFKFNRRGELVRDPKSHTISLNQVRVGATDDARWRFMDRTYVRVDRLDVMDRQMRVEQAHRARTRNRR